MCPVLWAKRARNANRARSTGRGEMKEVLMLAVLWWPATTQHKCDHTFANYFSVFHMFFAGGLFDHVLLIFFLNW